jgi:hypothetical protein
MANERNGKSQRWVAPAWGLGAFVIVNLLLHWPRCFFRQVGYGNFCQGEGQVTGWVLLIAAVLVIAAIAGPAGRGFTKGFVGGLIGLTVLTTGTCTNAWMDPVLSVERATAPARRSFARERLRRKARREWIAAMNTRSPDIERGVALAAEVARCAFWVDRATAAPASEQDVIGRCLNLVVAYVGADTEPPPVRYVVPAPGSPDTALLVREAVRGDPGWRWSLVSQGNGTGSLALVAPDSGLAYHWPRITANADDVIEVLPREGAAPVAVNPVAELQLLAQCLKGIPAEEDRRVNSWGSWHLYRMVQRLCPGLADRVTDVVDHNHEMLLSLRRPLVLGEAPIALATYRVSLDYVRVPGSPFRFSLAAWSMTGLKGYLLGEDGVVRDSVLHR